MVNILGANSVSGGYEIDNSLRFNDDDTADLRRTFSSAGNRKLWTWSGWFKRTTLSGVVDSLFAGFVDANNRLRFNFHSSDTIEIFGKIGGTEVNVKTAAVFRDVSAWYHFVWVMDSAQSTAANRMKIYVNGVQITSFGTATYPAQNAESVINNNIGHFIGQRGDGASVLDGYLSEMHFINGVAKAPTDFGEVDDNGVWIPKRYSGSYGTNGFYLEFKETGTSQNSSGMGADTSGNDNHFASTNLAATDVTTDTPTNNFATFNSIFSNARSGFTSTATLREGNTGATGVSTGGNVSTIGLNKGKWYWEIKIVTRVSNDMNIYLLSIPGPHAGVSLSRTMMWQSQDDLYFNNNQTNATKTADLVSFDDGDIVAVALDLDASTPNVILYKNGTVLNSGNAFNFNANERDGGNFIFPALGIENTSDNGLINFGNPAFAISSGNADANGYGNFEYAVPSGYYSLCTKNLAEFG